MFKQGVVYEILSWDELVKLSNSNVSTNYDLSFEDCEDIFLTDMKILCGHQFKCEQDCYTVEINNYKVYPIMCKTISTIDHPSHYNASDHETIDIIESMGWGTGFNLGNALKYIMRCEHKTNKSEDLKKAIWYLKRELKEEK